MSGFAARQLVAGVMGPVRGMIAYSAYAAILAYGGWGTIIDP